jgi:hypothetical protein
MAWCRNTACTYLKRRVLGPLTSPGELAARRLDVAEESGHGHQDRASEGEQRLDVERFSRADLPLSIRPLLNQS